MIELTLPYPPTVNTYWRHVGRRTLLSKKGREYRGAVLAIVAERFRRLVPFTVFAGDVEVCIVAHPPDKRRRDLDNLPKAILDSLEHAGVFEDDSQVARLVIERRPLCRPDGKVKVTIAEIPPTPDEET